MHFLFVLFLYSRALSSHFKTPNSLLIPTGCGRFHWNLTLDQQESQNQISCFEALIQETTNAQCSKTKKKKSKTNNQSYFWLLPHEEVTTAGSFGRFFKPDALPDITPKGLFASPLISIPAWMNVILIFAITKQP